MQIPRLSSNHLPRFQLWIPDLTGTQVLVLVTQNNNPLLVTALLHNPGNQIWSSQSQYTNLDKPETPAINPSDIPVPKRSRLPSSTPNDPVLDDSERELQAKAKRLARFKDELSQPESTDKIQKVQQVEIFSIT
ncbi:hypothetical protein L2E82_08339 [Cichorium intybus]|uniref:Uncharacterized protein n=1 Tax=Cichorium intybus TaxID=13427 RepID=A0ACB9G600_CICIN|nr:hypothetical protein L2E82_08339 [Cichorium intybus]